MPGKTVAYEHSLQQNPFHQIPIKEGRTRHFEIHFTITNACSPLSKTLMLDSTAAYSPTTPAKKKSHQTIETDAEKNGVSSFRFPQKIKSLRKQISVEKCHTP